MDTPVRKYQKQKDYQRHKLFRKMKRRRKAAIEQAKDAPMKQLRRKLKMPKFEDGKDNKPNVFQLADGTFVNSHNEPLDVLDYAGVEDPTKWTYVDKKGNRYTPRATRTLTEGEQFTQRQIENEQNTRSFEFTPYIEGANEGAAAASLMMGFPFNMAGSAYYTAKASRDAYNRNYLGTVLNGLGAVTPAGSGILQATKRFASASNARDILSNPNNFRFEINNPEANLFYDYDRILNTNKTNLLPTDVKDPTVPTVNKIFRAYGYKEIDPFLSSKQQEEILLDNMRQHRRVLRGVYPEDPKLSPNKNRNLNNLREQALREYGDTSDESLLRTAASVTAKEDTGHGKQGFRSYLNSGSVRPIDKSDEYFGYQPLYTSNRAETAEGYSKGTAGDHISGGSYMVQVPINDKPGDTYLNRWMANEFPVTDESGRLTYWRSVDLPHLQKYGTHFWERFGKDDVDLFNPNVIENAGARTPLSNESIVNKAIKEVNAWENKSLQEHGFDNFQMRLDETNKILNRYGLSPLPKLKYNPGIQDFDNTRLLIDLDEQIHQFYTTSMTDIERAVRIYDETEKLPAWLKSTFGILEDKGLISHKQYYRYENAIKNNDVEKIKEFDPAYALKRMIKKTYANYNTTLRNRMKRLHIENWKINKHNAKLHSDDNILGGYSEDLLKGKAFDANHELQFINWNKSSEDGLHVFTTEGIRNPNPDDLTGTHYVFVAPRDTRIGDVISKESIQTGRVGHGHSGNYYPGTSKNLGALLPFGVGGTALLGYNSLGQPIDTYKHGKDSGIHINPKNRGKFNALKKRTGKTTEQLTHSKNPLTRKRAIFAQNAKKWKH